MLSKRNFVIKVDSYRVLSCYYYSFVEWCAVRNAWVKGFLVRSRREAYSTELKRTGVSKGDSVCVIGCGFWPYMVQMLTIDFQADVSAYDNNRYAVRNARRYLDRCDIKKKIMIEFGDGTDIDYSSFDLVIIAINVWPIYEVLTRIGQTLHTGKNVMVRGMQNDIDLLLAHGLNENFEKIDEVKHPRSQTSLLRLRIPIKKPI